MPCSHISPQLVITNFSTGRGRSAQHEIRKSSLICQCHYSYLFLLMGVKYFSCVCYLSSTKQLETITYKLYVFNADCFSRDVLAKHEFNVEFP